LGDQTRSWTIVPQSTLRAANQPYRALATRIYDHRAGGGSVAAAYFDEVKTTAPVPPDDSGSNDDSDDNDSSGSGGGGGCFISTFAYWCQTVH
jgi:hypothetical protein